MLAFRFTSLFGYFGYNDKPFHPIMSIANSHKMPYYGEYGALVETAERS